MAVVERVSARRDAEAQIECRTVEARPSARARRYGEVEPMILEPAPEEDDEFDAEASRNKDAENIPTRRLPRVDQAGEES